LTPDLHEIRRRSSPAFKSSESRGAVDEEVGAAGPIRVSRAGSSETVLE
jgi:hypothetical protein